MNQLLLILLIGFGAAWVATAALAAGRDTPAGLLFLPGSILFAPVIIAGLALAAVASHFTDGSWAEKHVGGVASVLLIAPGFIMIWAVYPITYLTRRRRIEDPPIYTEPVRPHELDMIRSYLTEHHICTTSDGVWAADGGIIFERVGDGYELSAPANSRVWDLELFNDTA